MKKEIAAKILAETEAGYDLIAEKFSATRKHFWWGLEWIGDYAQDGDRILDFGCGNGRLLELFGEKKIEYTGVDVSEKLIEIARQKYPAENVKFQKINSHKITQNEDRITQKNNSDSISPDSLPFTDNYFNSVYSIAVFHHLPSRDLRKEIVKEIYRTLKPGGRVIITVWNLYQPKYLKNLLGNWLGKLKGQSNLDWKDCYISFTDNQGRIFQRYHHAFTRRELKRLFIKAGFEVEKCETIGGRNLVLVGRKLPFGGDVVK